MAAKFGITSAKYSTTGFLVRGAILVSLLCVFAGVVGHDLGKSAQAAEDKQAAAVAQAAADAHKVEIQAIQACVGAGGLVHLDHLMNFIGCDIQGSRITIQ